VRGVMFYDDNNNNNAGLERAGVACWTFEIGFPCYRGPYLADLLSYGVNDIWIRHPGGLVRLLGR